MDTIETNQPLLTDIAWQRDYRTSSRDAVDILDDFYVPLLDRAVLYDRVAGYFRSSSIKLALRGFGSFVRRGGKARFIVGAEMDAHDVAVLTADHDQVLTEILDREIDVILDGQEPSREPTGFELLAWMFWKESLDIRVAVVQRESTERKRFDGRDFAYAHEKWAVVQDATGSRLGFSGSLNESRTALQENAENISVFCDWQGDDPTHRIDDMSADFQHLWEGRHETIKVVTIPEAIRKKLISVAERADRLLRRVRRSEVIDVSEEERAAWRRIVDAPRTQEGRFLGITSGPVEPWPHQEFVSRRIVETYPRSMIVADEVGLGKTIEIGGAIRELVLSGKASRILILPPATLTRQWQIEMKEKFLLSFSRADGPKKHEILDDAGSSRVAPYAPMFQPDLLILSAQTFAREEAQARFVHAEDWDLIVVDEAHYATNGENEPDPLPFDPAWQQRNGDTLLRKAVRLYASRKTPALILATATPMQVRKKQAYDLMRLTELGGSFMRSDGTSDAYYEAVMRIKDEPTARHEDEILLRAFVQEVRYIDPDYFTFCMEFYAIGMRRDFERWLEGEISFKKAAPVSSKRRKMSVVLHAMAPLSRVMLRHGRDLLREYRKHGLLKAGLANRHVRSESVRMDIGEVQAYEQIEAYCKGLKASLERHAPEDLKKKAGGQTNFFLSFLRLRFASSTFAAWETVKRRRDRVDYALSWLERSGQDRTPATRGDEDEFEAMNIEDREDDPAGGDAPLPNRSIPDLREEKVLLNDLVTYLDALDPSGRVSSKDRRLLELLDPRHNTTHQTNKQTIVFTRFGDTMRHLLRHLRTRLVSIPMATFSGAGGMFYEAGETVGRAISRTEVKNLFLEGKVSLLVCTDAAAEGLNLQVADLLINFDLPWNPAKVEQRIGRIDRIGQLHGDIYVANMAYDGSAELDVYGRLLERLDDANLVVGTQQIALLPIDEQDFARLADRSIPQEDRDAILVRAQGQAEEVSRSYRQREMDVVALAEIHAGLQEEWHAGATWSREDAWKALVSSEFLARNGARLEDDEFVVPKIEDFNEVEIRFTTDRQRFGKGGISFAAWGDPDFDRISFDMCGMPSFDPVTSQERQDRIATVRQRADLHWKLAEANTILLRDIVEYFTGWESDDASRQQRKAAIESRIGSERTKRIRPNTELYGMELASIVRSSIDRANVEVPRKMVEVAVDEAL